MLEYQVSRNYLPKYDFKNHKNIGLIHFGNYDFTTIDIDKKTKPYTKINSLEFIPLTHDNLKNVEIINKDISTRIINTYYPEYLPIGSKVNAEFIISKLETINNNEQQKNNTAPLKPKKPASLIPKKGGRTKKRLRKHTHNRRRKMKKQTKRRKTH